MNICMDRWMNIWMDICMVGSQGGTLIFSSYVGSGPASTVHPPPQKKYQEFQAPQKIFEILPTPNSVPRP